MGDLFHEAVPFEFVDYIFAVMGRCRQHTFMLLTKRPERMAEYLTASRYQEVLGISYKMKFIPEGMGMGISNPNNMNWWPHVWLGITAENQTRADERIPILLQIPAARHFVSIEPMLAPIMIKWWLDGQHENGNRLDWVIMGQETGPGARPAKAEWFNSTINQCRVAGVPLFIKKAPAGVEIIRQFPEGGGGMDDKPMTHWIEGTVKEETELAVLIITSDKREVWIPKSVITYGHYAGGEEVKLEVKTWWAENEGLA